MTNEDDDVAGITVTPTSGLVTNEAGGTAAFAIAADTPPTADVTVQLTSSNTGEGIVSPALVTLSAGSTAPVIVTVTGVDDAIVDGPIAFTIVTGDPASADTAYDALGAGDVADVSVTNEDDEVPLATIIIAKTTDPEGKCLDGQQIVISGLRPGSYNPVVTVPADWDLDSIVCDDANSSGDVNTGTVTFQLDPGETVTALLTYSGGPPCPPHAIPSTTWPPGSLRDAVLGV